MTELTMFESILFIISTVSLTIIAFFTGFSIGKNQGWKEANDFAQEMWAREEKHG
mgnify:CR=1 FL=1